MSVAVSTAWCLLVKASLHPEAAERPQWPRLQWSRLYLLSRPRSHGRMPSLAGDSGQVLGVQGWASTRMRNLSLVLHSATQGSWTVAVGGTEPWVVLATQGGEVGLVRLASTRERAPPVDKLWSFKSVHHFVAVKVVHSKSSDKLESSLTLRVALSKS